MKTIEEIDAELAKLRLQLEEIHGTECEVYTRIVGYYRSLRNWNKGKKEEYRERILFHIPEDDPAAQPGKAQPDTDEIAEYRYFFRKTCPRCPSVKEYVSTLPLTGESVDVDTEEGMNEAQSLNILSTPTVVFFDRNGRPIHEAHSVEQLENLRPMLEIQEN